MTYTVCYHLYVKSKKKNKANEWIKKKKQKQTHRYREQYNGYQWEERMRDGKIGVADLEAQTIMYKINKL